MRTKINKVFMLSLAITLISTASFAQDDYASTGDNILPKKETFAQKIKRFEESGFFIAVAESSVSLMTQDVSITEGNLAHKGDAKACKECFKGKTEDVAKKLQQSNPEAFKNVIRRLLEASGRGMWSTDDETLDKLRELYSDADDLIETGSSTQ